MCAEAESKASEMVEAMSDSIYFADPEARKKKNF